MATFTPVGLSESIWYPNSLVMSHMTPDEVIFSTKTPYSRSDKVLFGNGVLLPIKSIGNVYLQTPNWLLSLTYVVHAPNLKHNLLFFCHLCQDNNCTCSIYRLLFFVKDNTPSGVLLRGSSHGNLYPIHVSTI